MFLPRVWNVVCLQRRFGHRLDHGTMSYSNNLNCSGFPLNATTFIFKHSLLFSLTEIAIIN
jgi:hypothetical protein